MPQDADMTDDDAPSPCRAAWLHYVGGLTQSAVAKRLGMPSVKAHRLIAKAVADGVVKVTIDGDIAECVELEVGSRAVRPCLLRGRA
jgi:DNA-binding transcriptional regulator LsrR (DeoR family)